MMNRREFCKKAMIVVGGIALPLYRPGGLQPRELQAEKEGKSKVRWAFLVDTHKCVGCGLLVKACKIRSGCTL